MNTTTYENAGVDTDREEEGLARLIEIIKPTWPLKGIGTVKLDIGHYANVIDIGGGTGIAISSDGVGSKVLIAQRMHRYDTVGIDCVAMNVNDLICVGAKPLSMTDYIAVQKPIPELLAALAQGLAEGARRAGISISGGEIAQLPEIINGDRKDYGFDLAGTAIGLVKLDRILVGKGIKPGDVVIGIESSGLHSNGYTLARRILEEEIEPQKGADLGGKLLEPTHIYVKEAMALLEAHLNIKAFAHITSDGLLNLNRVESDVDYVIDKLPPVPDIFDLLQRCGSVSWAEMFQVYNMGIGFCVVLPKANAERALNIIHKHGKKAWIIGHTEAGSRQVFVKQHGLVGVDTSFASVAA
jgi:phosphoribosylformylglycinamidine cyclo-ligase